MTTYTCPDGHSSTSGDYCDVCGAPIGGTSPAAAPLTPPPLPGPGGSSAAPASPAGNPFDLAVSGGSVAAGAPVAERICPHCQASNLPGALYCEVCGYDFTTGQAPRPLDTPSPAPAADAAPAPAADAPATGGAPPTGPVDIPPPVPDPSATPSAAAPPVTPDSAPGHVEWVTEIWVDPDWYASQDVTEPCPSAGMPLVIPILERTVLVGRLSTSRNIHPQIDLSSDNGVSRRHAQLNSDGQRWWVEDLQSANGTFVGGAGGPLPSTPIPVGQRVELADDDRIYLGAWTRLVVRRATPEESTLGT